MSDLPPDQTASRGASAQEASASVDMAADLPVAAKASITGPIPAAPPTGTGFGPTPGFGPAPGAPVFEFKRHRWLPSIVVASIIAAVVLGGVGLDNVIAAPSAGLVTVGGSVTINAAPGWILASPPGDTSGGIELEKATALLTTQVVSSSYGGDSASMLSDQEKSLSGNSAQISYGGAHRASVGGHDTSYVAFEAAVPSRQRSGIVDGELVCMVVNGSAVVIVAAAPQGDFDPIVNDVAAMLKSVGAGH